MIERFIAALADQRIPERREAFTIAAGEVALIDFDQFRVGPKAMKMVLRLASMCAPSETSSVAVRCIVLDEIGANSTLE